MAQGIATAIRINDQMSPALRSMNKALMVVLNSFESMQSATADPINTAAISEARSELAKVSTTLDDVENNARQASNAQEQFTNSVKQSDNAMSGLVKKVGTLIATYASFQAMGNLVNLSDQMTQIDSRLNLVVDDKGSSYIDGDSYVIGRVAKRTVKINQEEGVAMLRNKGLLNCITEKTTYTVNEEEVEKAVAEEILTEEDVRSFTTINTSYSVSVKAKEDMPEVEVSAVARKKK